MSRERERVEIGLLNSQTNEIFTTNTFFLFTFFFFLARPNENSIHTHIHQHISDKSFDLIVRMCRLSMSLVDTLNTWLLSKIKYLCHRVLLMITIFDKIIIFSFHNYKLLSRRCSFVAVLNHLKTLEETQQFIQKYYMLTKFTQRNQSQK